MKILMTTDNLGGVWTYALDLAAELRERDVEVVLAVMGDRLTGEQREQAEAAGVASLQARTCALEWMPGAWDEVDAAGEWLLDLAVAELPDVIHLNSYAHAAMQWQSPVVVVAHSCVRSWWRAVRHEEAPVEWDRYTRRVRDGLAAADVVVAPTTTMLDEIETIYGSARSSVVIHNGRRGQSFLAQAKEPYVFGAGRLWDAAKNVAALQEAARGCSWPIVVAGDGDVDASSPIMHVGQLTPQAMQEHLAKAAIFCAPARYEPFGLAALEAAMCGCALVLGDIASLREVWGDAATYVDPDDPDAIATILNSLIASPEDRDEMSRRALARAARYTSNDMADAYLRVYTGLDALKSPVGVA